jgi:hypothetical protein
MIRIFFTCQTSDTLIILAHFVEEIDFLTDNENAYLKYSEDHPPEDSKDNFYMFYQYSAGSKLFAIPNKEVKKYCDKCVLTVAVYSLYTSTTFSMAFYEIEVSQQETGLSVGDTKMGYLEKTDTYVYQLDTPTADSLLTVRDLNKESTSQTNCFRLSLTGDGKYVNEEFFVIKKASTKQHVFITSVSEVCHFEISYTSQKSHVKIVM